MDKAHACGAQIYFPHVPGTMTFGVSEMRVLALQYRRLGVGLFGDRDDEYMKNSVPRKRTHRAGLLD